MVAVAGVAAITLSDFFAIKLPFAPEQLVDQIIAIATAFGVWAVPNES
jgi:hypothetical protein